MRKIAIISWCCLLFPLAGSAQPVHHDVPRIWDDKALADWATPIAALATRPNHFNSAEYYSVPGDNLRTYPVYRPDREPPGYWEWLQKQRPEPLVDTAKLSTREDWIKAGEEAFRGIDVIAFRTSDPEKIRQARDPKTFVDVWTRADGSLVSQRWVVTKSGIQLSLGACAACHTRVADDGRVLWGAPPRKPPDGKRTFIAVNVVTTFPLFRGDSAAVAAWKQFTVPWTPDERVEKFREMSDPELRALLKQETPANINRIHGSPFYTTKVPDLNSLQYSRYVDATGTHRLRGPEDVGRYSAFVTGTDPMEFGRHKILTQEQRRVPSRYADEVLYAIGVYLLSLEPPANPNAGPADRIARGRKVFERENCNTCHASRGFTNGKLTLALGFVPGSDHPNRADILNLSVGTDPGLALRTRKGTGFYKIPSLRGVWYRPLLLHDGSAASLEEMFDAARLDADHVPGGWKGPGVIKRPIPGHPFGLALSAEDKAALLAFLRSI
jgi:mono/diheme cytochrome c family protein